MNENYEEILEFIRQAYCRTLKRLLTDKVIGEVRCRVDSNGMLIVVIRHSDDYSDRYTYCKAGFDDFIISGVSAEVFAKKIIKAYRHKLTKDYFK